MSGEPLPGAAGAWEELARERDGLPTEDAPWSIAAAATYPGEGWNVVLEDEAGCNAVAPLVRRGSTLELVGARELGEPADLLARSPEALAGLAERIAADRRALVLHRVPLGSPTLPALREAYGRGAWINVREVEGYPTIELEERWLEPGGGLSSSRRSSLRRARRRAERSGEVGVELLRPEPAEVDSLLDRAFAIEARSWKGEEGTALIQVPMMESFFRRYALELARRGALRLDFLTIGGRGVAMQLGARWNGSHWLFKIGYDAAHRACSPGQILLAESVAAATREGLGRYELLGSRDSWTDVWTETVHRCAKVIVTPRSTRGVIALGTIRRDAARRDLDRRLSRAKRSVVDNAKQRYVAGPELADALAVERRYRDSGYATSVGYWNRRSDSQQEVAEQVMACAAELDPGGEISIKLTALGGDGPALEGLAELCGERDLRLHIDALGPEAADLTRETALRLAAGSLRGRVGCTLPGRWPRSVADAAILRGEDLSVRIVKGEVPAEGEEDADPREGFLAVVAAMAEGQARVEVATQDAGLAGRALDLLDGAESPRELQVLHATASTAAVRVARRRELPVRVYVPYGAGRLPYDGSTIRHQPLRAFSLARDLLPVRSRQPLLLAPPLLALRDLVPF